MICHSVAKSCRTPCNPMDYNMPGFPAFTIFWNLLKLISIKSMMPSNHLKLCHPLLSLPSIFHSIRVFSNESALWIRWPKYWSFNISPSSEYSELISLTIDWLISLLYKGLSRVFTTTTVRKHQFFSAQPSLQSNSNIPKWLLEKTIVLTIQTLVGKVMSLLFNILSSFVIGEGNGNPLQYSCLENPMDGGACRLQSMGPQSWTRLSDFTSLLS